MMFVGEWWWFAIGEGEGVGGRGPRMIEAKTTHYHH